MEEEISKAQFDAVVEIEFHLFALRKVIEAHPIPSPIENAIDVATGFIKERCRRLAVDAIPHLEAIIKAKSFLGDDTTNAQNMLDVMNSHIKKE